MRSKFLYSLAFAALLPLAWSSPGLGAERLLLQPTELKSSWVAPDEPTVVRSQNVTVNLDLLRTAGKTLSVPLFDGETQEIEIVRTERIQERGEVWHAQIPGQRFSSATLVAVDNIVMGNIRLEDGRMFQIRHLSDGVHSLSEVDLAKMPREAQPVTPKPTRGRDRRSLPYMGKTGMDKCTDSPSSIDIMVVYTDDARAAAGGTANMVALVYLSVAETNQSYFNSNVNHRVRLVYHTEVTYTELGDIEDDLENLTDLDSVIDNVLTLRNTYGADTVVMITNTATYLGNPVCGLAWMMQTVSPAFEANAFAVVARACSFANLSFPHELGHNMGTDHDCPNATSTGPYSYNRGYSELTPTTGPRWRTIMSYQTSPSSARIPWWSNPLVNHPVSTDPMGGACPVNPPYSSDNAQVLNNTAATVANFRCTSPGVGNVWIKDTWEDTGGEPDPLTAGQDMWQSPYIWVRNSQDTNLVHQHQHENPDAGQTNYAYAKLHNGSSSPINGTLEFYVTNASTTLTWGSWTMVDSENVTVPAFSSMVVEGSWFPTATGHYCMVARWNSSADPMTHTETTDINYNTRQNNNIAWRNLNIVNFLDQWFSEGDLFVRSTSAGRFSLQIRPFNTATNRNFLEHGQVEVTLDPKLAQLWAAGGSRGRGFRAAEGGRLAVVDPEGAVLENIELDPKVVGTMTLTFTRDKETPRERFFIAVRQVDERGIAVGGVSYEIRNDEGVVPASNPGDPD